MFGFIKNTLSKIYSQCTSAFNTLFSRASFDQQALQELEKILIGADTGIKTTRTIIENLKRHLSSGTTGQEMKLALEQELLAILGSSAYQPACSLYLLVGINGSGKTTTAAKLAYKAKADGKKVLLVAADTFRAAATQQLADWATRLHIDIVTGKENQDPASVVFAGITKYMQEQYEVVIIDTAGRLQTKTNLMKELEKIRRVITAQCPDRAVCTLLTVDAMLGQNSFEQAKLFHESTRLDGIILTKMDGTGKGGIVFSIVHELKIPIAFISYGEQPEQLKLFNAKEYVHDLLNG